MSELVTIASFYTPAEAETLRALLGEAGIQAFVAEAEQAGLNFLLTPATGGAKLQTAAVDAERARELIAAHGGYHYSETDDGAESDGSTKCLACGETIDEDEDTCPKCGWSYDREED
jgi:hypothetical protein